MLKYMLIILTFLAGCNQALNEPNLEVVELNPTSVVEKSVPVFSQTDSFPMSVREDVKGNNLYVECVISNFKFSERNKKVENKSGTGYIQLYLNNQKIDDIYTAAFVVKGLPKGTHQIKLKLVHNDGTPYGVEKEFEVSIAG